MGAFPVPVEGESTLLQMPVSPEVAEQDESADPAQLSRPDEHVQIAASSHIPLAEAEADEVLASEAIAPVAPDRQCAFRTKSVPLHKQLCSTLAYLAAVCIRVSLYPAQCGNAGMMSVLAMPTCCSAQHLLAQCCVIRELTVTRACLRACSLEEASSSSECADKTPSAAASCSTAHHDPIVQITVQQLMHARLHPLLKAPVVRVHIVDRQTGAYLLDPHGDCAEQQSCEGEEVRTLTEHEQQELLSMEAHRAMVSVTDAATGASQVTTQRHVPAGQTLVRPQSQACQLCKCVCGMQALLQCSMLEHAGLLHCSRRVSPRRWR